MPTKKTTKSQKAITKKIMNFPLVKGGLRGIILSQKNYLKLFLQNPSEYLLGIFLLLITFAGIGLFYWHLKNLDFFGFDRLMLGHLGGGVDLSDDQKKEILKIEFWSMILGVIFYKIVFMLGAGQKGFPEKFIRIGRNGLTAFTLVFILSLFIPTKLESYYLEHLHQFGLAIVIGILFASAYTAVPQKNPLFDFLHENKAKIFWALFAFFAVWYLTVGFVKFLHIGHGGLDYTFFTQGVWHYSRLEEPIITYGGATKNFHAEHAHFFMAFLAPLWVLFDTPFILLFVDVLGMLSMGVVFYLLLKHWSKNKISPDLSSSTFFLIAGSFATFFYFGIQRALEHEFHEANLIAPLFLWTFYFLHTGKIKLYAIFTLILLLSKESSPIWVIFLGLYAIFFEKRIKVGLYSMLAALIYFPIVLGWVIPDLVGNGSYQHFSFKQLGDSPGAVVKTVMTNPALAFYTIFNAPPDYLAQIENPGTLEAMTQMKRNTLSHMFASFGYLSLFSPQMLFLGLPMIGERFLNSDDWRWSIYLYYNISYLPILILGLLFGLKSILSHHIFSQKNRGKVLVVFVAGLIITMSVLVNVKKKPMLLDITRENFWHFTEKEKTIWELTHIIPPEATLQTQSTILPFFAHRDYIKAFPRGQHESGEHLSGHNFWNYTRHQGKADPNHENYNENFANLTEFYRQEPEFTILNSDFIAYPLRAKEDVEEWIEKLKSTHDIVYDKEGTVVFRRQDLENIVDKNGNYPYREQ